MRFCYYQNNIAGPEHGIVAWKHIPLVSGYCRLIKQSFLYFMLSLVPLKKNPIFPSICLAEISLKLLSFDSNCPEKRIIQQDWLEKVIFIFPVKIQNLLHQTLLDSKWYTIFSFTIIVNKHFVGSCKSDELWYLLPNS